MPQQILDKRRRSLSIWHTSAILASVVEYLEDRIALTDFGDAPAPYPTTLSENGARHAEGGRRLGTSRDSESDGVHSATAHGDELADLADEDGVRFGALMVGALGATANVSVSGADQGARLGAWIDFNGDGSWGGVNEQIADSVPVTNGENFIRFDVPASARSGTTFARFRISTHGGLGIRGLGADGEVEDLSVQILSPVASNGRFGTERPIRDGDCRRLCRSDCHW